MEEENKVMDESMAEDMMEEKTVTGVSVEEASKAEENAAAEEEVKAEESVAAEEEPKAEENVAAEEAKTEEVAAEEPKAEEGLNVSGDEFEEEKTVSVYSQPGETVSAAYAGNAYTPEVDKDAIPKSRFAAGLMAVFPGGGLGCADFYVGNKKHGKIKLWVGAICLGISILLFILGVLTIWLEGLGIIFMYLGGLVICGYSGMYIWSIVEGILYFTGKRRKDAFGQDIVIDTQRSRYAAYTLGYWAGFGGAHNFYLGNKKNGIIQAAVTGGCPLFCWIPCIGQIIAIGGPVAMWIWAINEAKALKDGTVNVDGHGRALRD